MSIYDNSTGWLYRFRARAGMVLYIGRTRDLDTRMRKHRTSGKTWIEYVATVDLIPFWHPGKLKLAEAAAIYHDQPPYNEAFLKRTSMTDAALMLFPEPIYRTLRSSCRDLPCSIPFRVT